MKTLVFALWIVTNIVAVCDEQSRWPTAMVPTHNAEPTTQAERFTWLALRRVDGARGGSL